MSENQRRAAACIVGVALLITAGACSQRAPEDPLASGLRAITTAALLDDVRWLASPELAGRLAGSPGYAAAVRGVARRFEKLGLTAGGDDGFCQRLTVEYNQIVGEPQLAVMVADGARHPCRLGPDFTCRGFTGSGQVTAPVVFVGYGISQPERGYDDYAGVDVTGKIVLCLKPNPDWSRDDEAWAWRSSTPRVKSRIAADHGAVALLWVSPPREDFPIHGPIGSVLHGPGEQDLDFPQLEISLAVADRLLGGKGRLSALKKRIDESQEPASAALTTQAAIAVRAEYDPARKTCNVVGLLPGADPERRDEYLVIGAHLDHVGQQGEQLYFPGANDNASGAAAVLGLARAFVATGQRPARSVIFVLFAAEEQGLDGARHYVASPSRPLEQTVAMFNLDCVACGDSIKVGSGESSPELWELARRIDAEHADLTVAETWSGGGADATPFYEAGVHTLYWVTTHGYAHLHAPDDTLETLNGALYTELVQLAFRTAWEVAQGFTPSAAVISGEG